MVNGPIVIVARLPLGLMGKPLILHLNLSSRGVDLTKVWWLEEKGICFQSAVEHYIADIRSKLITLHFYGSLMWCLWNLKFKMFSKSNCFVTPVLVRVRLLSHLQVKIT